MHVGFVVPELQKLDETKSDAFCLCLFQEDWPLRLTPGLVDWRIRGHLSRQREAGWISCEEGEVILIPLSPLLPCDKLLIIGMGSLEEELTDERLLRGMRLTFDTLGKMRAAASVIHLPGRPNHVTAEKSIELLLVAGQEHPELEEVIVVESLSVQRSMERFIDSWHGVNPS